MPIDINKCTKVSTYKTVPSGEVKLLDLKQTDTNRYILQCEDTDGDIFTLAAIQFYKNPTDLTDGKYSKVNDFEIFDIFKKTKKGNKVFLDLLEVSIVFRGQGLGTHTLNEFEAIMKKEGIDVVCLKAHPLVTHRYGIIANKNAKQIREEKKKIQSFYTKHGYDFARKGQDYMFKYL